MQGCFNKEWQAAVQAEADTIKESEGLDHWQAVIKAIDVVRRKRMGDL